MLTENETKYEGVLEAQQTGQTGQLTKQESQHLRLFCSGDQ